MVAAYSPCSVYGDLDGYLTPPHQALSLGGGGRFLPLRGGGLSPCLPLPLCSDFVHVSTSKVTFSFDDGLGMFAKSDAPHLCISDLKKQRERL